MSHVEGWRDVVGYEGYYEVSDMGRVRSLSRLTVQNSNLIGRVLKNSLNGTGGYAAVSLAKDGCTKRRKVHLLVLEAFVGPRPVGMQGCHRNDDPSDAALSNLRWGTPESNHDDRKAHGAQKGESHNLSVITEATARKIKAMLAAGESASSVALELGVKKHIVANIKYNHSWNWL